MSSSHTTPSEVAFNAVSVNYGPRRALDNVSATIAAGEIVAVVGPNGCGKSTLLSLLTGHHPAFTGTVTVDGEDISTMRARDRARKIGVLRQHTGPLPDVPVTELVALGPQKLSTHQVNRTLARVGLDELATEPVAALSGGQLQRALLARALRHDPTLLVLDEPTNHLDVQHRFALMELLQDLRVTVLCALHDLDLAIRYTDDMLLLAEGQLRAHGHPDAVLTKSRVLEVFAIDSESVTTAGGQTHLLLRSARARAAGE